MAWSCKGCNHFLFSVGEDYCDGCKKTQKDKKDKKKAKKKAKRKAKKKAQKRDKKEKKKRIKQEISELKKNQKQEIQNKYKVIIEFFSEDSTQNNIYGLGSMFPNIDIRNTEKVKIISKNNSLQDSINQLELENEHIREALKELEAIKNETLK